MKKLHSFINVAEVGVLKSLLEAEGIACTTRNEHLSIASGSVPFTECYPELWVVHDDDFAAAQELLARWQHGNGQQLASWVCPVCGEENEGQFAACWQCGHLVESVGDEAAQE